MKSRIFCLVGLVLLLASAAQAVDWWWYEWVDNDWNNALNWTAWPPPDWVAIHGLPDENDKVELNREVYTEIGPGDEAVCNILYVGTDLSHTLGVVGGTLTVSSEVVLGRGGGTTGYMDVSGGIVSVNKDLNVGGAGLPEWAWEPGVGDLDVSGGEIDIGGSLVLGQTLTYDPGGDDPNIVNQTGSGTVQVDGGVIVAVGLTIEAGSLLGVYDDGMVVLAGDQLDLVNGYIDAGLIVGQASISTSGVYAGNTVIETLTSLAAQAVDWWWSEEVVDDDWNNALNWIAWPPPDWVAIHGLPDENDKVELNREVYTEIGPGDEAVCNILYVGTDLSHTLGVVGGTLTVSSEVVLGRGGGTTGYMDVSGGIVSVNKDLNVGGAGLPEWVWEPGVGDLDVSGGEVDIGGSLVLGQTLTYDPGGDDPNIVSQTGSGTVQVDGGVIVAVGLTIEAGSLLGVYDDGMVVLAWDQLDLVNGYIDAGLIVGQASISTSGVYAGNTVIEALAEPGQ